MYHYFNQKNIAYKGMPVLNKQISKLILPDTNIKVYAQCNTSNNFQQTDVIITDNNMATTFLCALDLTSIILRCILELKYTYFN